MATVINNPDQGNGGGTGMIIGAVVLLIVVVLFFVYGLPAMRNSGSDTNVNVPDEIQVDVNDSGSAQ